MLDWGAQDRDHTELEHFISNYDSVAELANALVYVIRKHERAVLIKLLAERKDEF